MRRPPRSASIADLEQRAATGDAAAGFELYWAYATGDQVGRDAARAMALLGASAAGGHAPAQVALGRERFGQDRAGALALFLAAAAQGDAAGQLAAGQMLFHGRFAARDEVRGLALLAAAAAAGGDDAVREHARAARQVAAGARSDGDNLALALREHGLGAGAAEVLALVRPSVRLVAVRRDDAAIPVGASKLGGAPDLPPGHRWPHRGDRPLAFIAQLDLATLADHHDDADLPREGVLAFFYDADQQPWGDPGEEDGWSVAHHPAAGLVRTAGAGTGFPACALDAFAELTLPPSRSALARGLAVEPATYDQLLDTHQGIHRRWPRADGELHRALGNPDAIQGDMTRRIEYRWRGADLDAPSPELEDAARRWRLLLQIDSDPAAAMGWGDGGRLFYWIREEDLRDRRWGEVRLQLQCG